LTQGFDPNLAAWLNNVIPIRVLVLVKLKRWTDGEWRSDCPLCGQAGALYVHPRKNVWSCSSGCGEKRTPVEWAMKQRGGRDEAAAIAYLEKLAVALRLPVNAPSSTGGHP